MVDKWLSGMIKTGDRIEIDSEKLKIMKKKAGKEKQQNIF